MRLTQIIDILQRDKMPDDRDFPFKFTHIAKDTAKDIRKKHRPRKAKQ